MIFASWPYTYTLSIIRWRRFLVRTMRGGYIQARQGPSDWNLSIIMENNESFKRFEGTCVSIVNLIFWGCCLSYPLNVRNSSSNRQPGNWGSDNQDVEVPRDLGTARGCLWNFANNLSKLQNSGAVGKMLVTEA